MRLAVLPLIVIWLALHAALLAILLGFKFFGAKLVLLTMLAAGAVWFLLRQPRRLALPRHRVV
ncbi:MAG TPA: hypothetical protein VN685_01730 [Rhizomicrobium sp.]|nr:hypothetical protein [Rhizomicrobium sp.]